jgi:uncharacterized phage protein (TIGR01671 family)
MREILFIGKKQNGEWLQGDLVHYGDKILIFSENAQNSPDYYEVDPETVGQFTGVTDKNGVEIFEGDILLFGDKSFAVEWQNDIVGFGYLYTSDRFLGCDGINCEIIGNIYNNPELLK